MGQPGAFLTQSFPHGASSSFSVSPRCPHWLQRPCRQARGLHLGEALLPWVAGQGLQFGGRHLPWESTSLTDVRRAINFPVCSTSYLLRQSVSSRCLRAGPETTGVHTAHVLFLTVSSHSSKSCSSHAEEIWEVYFPRGKN